MQRKQALAASRRAGVVRVIVASFEGGQREIHCVLSSNCRTTDIVPTLRLSPQPSGPSMTSYAITHLRQLEAESIHIIREVAADSNIGWVRALA